MVWSQYTFSLRDPRERHHIPHFHRRRIDPDAIDRHLYNSALGGEVGLFEALDDAPLHLPLQVTRPLPQVVPARLLLIRV